MGSPRPFTQTDFASAFKAAKAAGFKAARVEVVLANGNKLIAVAHDSPIFDGVEAQKNLWDEVSDEA